MATGNYPGGRIADQYENRGLIYGYTGVLLLLIVIGVAGSTSWVLLPALFGVGATMMFAIPTIQVRLTSFAPDAPTLMGALNLAALNLANSLGAIGGAITIGAGWGTLSTVWAGFALTTAGLILYTATLARVRLSAVPRTRLTELSPLQSQLALPMAAMQFRRRHTASQKEKPMTKCDWSGWHSSTLLDILKH